MADEPILRPEDDEPIDAEVFGPDGRPVGQPPRNPIKLKWRVRFTFSVILIGSGVVVGLIGLLLTLTIVGAPLGLPLLGLGLLCVVLGVAIALGAGHVVGPGTRD